MSQIPTRAELQAAIDDPSDNNPLSDRIAAVVQDYAKALADQAKRAGAVPDPLVLPVPQTELEAFALELFISDIRTMGIRIAFKSSAPTH
jgi:hypothetical protein